jgi:hypothetical protein
MILRTGSEDFRFPFLEDLVLLKRRFRQTAQLGIVVPASIGRGSQ